MGFRFTAVVLGCTFLFSGCAAPPVSQDKLLQAYSRGDVTLEGPLEKYKGLPLNLDPALVGNSAFVGLTVFLNTPHASIRPIGSHPATIFYSMLPDLTIAQDFFESGAPRDTRRYTRTLDKDEFLRPGSIPGENAKFAKRYLAKHPIKK